MRIKIQSTLVSLIAVGLLVFAVSDAFARGRYRPPPSRPYKPSESTFTRPSSGYASSGSTHSLWLNATKAYGAPTTDPAKAYVLLLVAKSGDVFATTNYYKEAYFEPNVLKLEQGDLINGDTLASTVNSLLGSAEATRQATLKIVLEEPIDSPSMKSIFDTEKQSFKLNTTDFRHAELYMRGSDQVLGLERIDRPSPPPRWAAKLNDCCVFTGVPPDFSAWNKLSQVPFKSRDAQILSLFDDSTTGNVFKKRGGAHDISHPSELNSSGADAILSVIASRPPGTPLIVVGHTVGPVIRVEGKNQFDVSFEQLTLAAKDAGRPLILLGCYSADHFTQTGVASTRDHASGALNLLRPQDVSQRVLSAMSTSKNFRELNERLSSENLYIWMSSNFMRDVHEGSARTVRAPLYKRMANGVWSIVGFIFLYLPCSGEGGCGR
jgi:hypothetical protein